MIRRTVAGGAVGNQWWGAGAEAATRPRHAAHGRFSPEGRVESSRGDPLHFVEFSSSQCRFFWRCMQHAQTFCALVSQLEQLELALSSAPIFVLLFKFGLPVGIPISLCAWMR